MEGGKRWLAERVTRDGDQQRERSGQPVGHDWRSCYVKLLTRSSGGHGISHLSTTETLSIMVSM